MKLARESLHKNWMKAAFGMLFFVVFLLSVSIFFCSIFVYFSLLTPNDLLSCQLRCFDNITTILALFAFIFGGAFRVGYCHYFLAFANQGESHLEYIFTGFKRFFVSFLTAFFIRLFLLLWSAFSLILLLVSVYYVKDRENSVFVVPFILVLLLPAIAAIYRYSMSFFILADDPECGVFESIARSKAMMQGKKMKLFCLQWRFFWWHVLALCTLGIGYLWLIPYIKTSFAEFYENVK